MKKWRIWYNNNVIIECDNQQEWTDAPELGVQLVYQSEGYDQHGTKLGQIFMGSDWYWMHNGVIGQSDSATEMGVWIQNPAPVGAVSKRGLYITDEEMTQIMENFNNWLVNG